MGYSTLDCYHRMDFAFQGKHPPTKLAAMTATSNASHTQEPWLADNVTTNHLTSSLNNLSFPRPYNGKEHIIVGNG